MPKRAGKISIEVENHLKYSREARNSDKELHIRMLEQYGVCLTEHQKHLFKAMPSMETITRIRRKFQEKGQYPADQVIADDRHFRSLRMQQMNPSVGNIERVTEAPKAISWLDD